MTKSIYVGNLPFHTSEAEIRDLFSPFGPVHRVKVVMDRETGKPRGFAFVEMDADAVDAAVQRLNGQDFQGRPLRVNEAQERTPGNRPKSY